MSLLTFWTLKQYSSLLIQVESSPEDNYETDLSLEKQIPQCEISTETVQGRKKTLGWTCFEMCKMLQKKKYSVLWSLQVEIVVTAWGLNLNIIPLTTNISCKN